MKSLGLRIATLPACPKLEDHDSPIYREFWAAAVAPGLPISFHVLKGGKNLFAAHRGPRIESMLSEHGLTADEKHAILCGNVSDLCKIDIDQLQAEVRKEAV